MRKNSVRPLVETLLVLSVRSVDHISAAEDPVPTAGHLRLPTEDDAVVGVLVHVDGGVPLVARCGLVDLKIRNQRLVVVEDPRHHTRQRLVVAGRTLALPDHRDHTTFVVHGDTGVFLNAGSVGIDLEEVAGGRAIGRKSPRQDVEAVGGGIGRHGGIPDDHEHAVVGDATSAGFSLSPMRSVRNLERVGDGRPVSEIWPRPDQQRRCCSPRPRRNARCSPWPPAEALR